jgi:hypothetical protein
MLYLFNFSFINLFKSKTCGEIIVESFEDQFESDDDTDSLKFMEEDALDGQYILSSIIKLLKKTRVIFFT